MNLGRLTRTFFTGLATVLPILLTVAVLLWVVRGIESLLSIFIPNGAYFPGFGVAAAVVLVFLVGVLMEAVLFRRLMAWFDGLLQHIPLVKTVYGAVRDLMSLFGGGDKSGFSKVVLVQWPDRPGRQIGFVTIETFAGLPFDPGPGTVAVYLPMSYQIGGYTVFLPREVLTPINMTLEEAMRFVVTAGMSSGRTPPA
jgi:uncharacterized membrane protein